MLSNDTNILLTDDEDYCVLSACLGFARKDETAVTTLIQIHQCRVLIVPQTRQLDQNTNGILICWGGGGLFQGSSVPWKGRVMCPNVRPKRPHEVIGVLGLLWRPGRTDL
eukprot:scaffold3747_cov98-Amphora_coffeaeformis.AAC.1